MKLSNKIILSSLLSGLSCAVARLGENADPNASSLAVRGEAMTNVKCKLLVEEVDGDEKDGDEEEDEVNLICETMGEEDSFLFSLEGHNLPPTSDVESGRTVLLISDAILQPDTMSLHVPEEATVEFEPLPLVPQNRMLNSWTIGERTVLAVRVVAADKSSSYSEEGLSNKIFGTYGDKMTMSSQFEACSYGKLKFVPLEGTYNGVEINNGVVTVTLSNSVAGSNRHVFEYYTLEALKEIFGPWDSTTNTWIADHVMIAFPGGLVGTAYAKAYHWLTVYNDHRIGYPSYQMHEIGHNLGLAHSGHGKNQYGDQSGIMGRSYKKADGPYMCFNGPKNWQMGWYTDHEAVFTAEDLSNGSMVHKIVGLSHYGNLASSDDEIVYARFVVSDKAYFVSFNSKSGVNAETKEAANKVMVHKRDTKAWFGLSTLVQIMDGGAAYTVSHGGTNIQITVLSIDSNNGIPTATVKIQDLAVNDDEERTLSPTRSPTVALTSSPTRSPVDTPGTSSPTESPMASPVSTPAPSQAVGSCEDAEGIIYKNVGCSWVRKNTRKRCDKRYKGKKLREHCPKTCGDCLN